MKRYSNECAAFHIGRGGKDYKEGHIEFLGIHDIEYYVDHYDIFSPDSDNPEAEWTDCDGNGVGLTNEMIRTGVGRIDMDGQYDSTYTMRIADIMPDSPEWDALIAADSLEAYETMYTSLDTADERTLERLRVFFLAAPEALKLSFIENFCTDMGWSWYEPEEEVSAGDIVPICSDGDRTLYAEIGPWEEVVNYTIGKR